LPYQININADDFLFGTKIIGVLNSYNNHCNNNRRNFYFCRYSIMKNKHFILIALILLSAFIINSCKKSSQNPLEALFTGDSWQLASITAFYYTGNTLDSTQTISPSCGSGLIQYFTFYSNNTCTYTNFECIAQTTTAAQWSLSANQLFLSANVVCKDTSATGTSMPFSYASIQNLGHFSLVLQTGDIQPNYSLTQPRKIIEYGFIREKITTGN
jgi:hypothetical protein